MKKRLYAKQLVIEWDVELNDDDAEPKELKVHKNSLLKKVTNTIINQYRQKHNLEPMRVIMYFSDDESYKLKALVTLPIRLTTKPELFKLENRKCKCKGEQTCLIYKTQEDIKVRVAAFKYQKRQELPSYTERTWERQEHVTPQYLEESVKKKSKSKLYESLQDVVGLPQTYTDEIIEKLVYKLSQEIEEKLSNRIDESYEGLKTKIQNDPDLKEQLFQILLPTLHRESFLRLKEYEEEVKNAGFRYKYELEEKYNELLRMELTPEIIRKIDGRVNETILNNLTNILTETLNNSKNLSDIYMDKIQDKIQEMASYHNHLMGSIQEVGKMIMSTMEKSSFDLLDNLSKNIYNNQSEYSNQVIRNIELVTQNYQVGLIEYTKEYTLNYQKNIQEDFIEQLKGKTSDLSAELTEDMRTQYQRLGVEMRKCLLKEVQDRAMIAYQKSIEGFQKQIECDLTEKGNALSKQIEENIITTAKEREKRLALYNINNNALNIKEVNVNLNQRFMKRRKPLEGRTIRRVLAKPIRQEKHEGDNGEGGTK